MSKEPNHIRLPLIVAVDCEETSTSSNVDVRDARGENRMRCELGNRGVGTEEEMRAGAKSQPCVQEMYKFVDLGEQYGRFVGVEFERGSQRIPLIAPVRCTWGGASME